MEYRGADRIYRVQYMIRNIKMMRGCIIDGYLGVGVDVPVTSPCCWSFVSTVQDFTHASTYIIRSRHLFSMYVHIGWVHAAISTDSSTHTQV